MAKRCLLAGSQSFRHRNPRVALGIVSAKGERESGRRLMMEVRFRRNSLSLIERVVLVERTQRVFGERWVEETAVEEEYHQND